MSTTGHWNIAWLKCLQQYGVVPCWSWISSPNIPFSKYNSITSSIILNLLVRTTKFRTTKMNSEDSLKLLIKIFNHENNQLYMVSRSLKCHVLMNCMCELVAMWTSFILSNRCLYLLLENSHSCSSVKRRKVKATQNFQQSSTYMNKIIYTNWVSCVHNITVHVSHEVTAWEEKRKKSGTWESVEMSKNVHFTNYYLP